MPTPHPAYRRATLPVVLLSIALGLATFLMWPGRGQPVLHARARIASGPDLARFVDPFIGTLRDGNTFPGADMPFGMVQWSPDSSAGGLSKPGGYNARDLIITGFSLTHLSGAGCGAFGNVSFQPTTRPLTQTPEPNGSPYSDRFVPASQQAHPGFYGVRFHSGISVQLTVTTRTGFGAFHFPSRQGTVLLNTGAGAGGHSNLDGAMNASIRLSPPYVVTGSVTAGHFCNLPNVYTLYFAARFRQPFSRFGTWQAGRFLPGARAAHGPHSGTYLMFDTARDRGVEVKVGLSYVNPSAALHNVDTENPGWSFAQTARRTRITWNHVLGRIQVSGGDSASTKIFYTALYHALLFPSTFSDVDGRYRGFDGLIHHTGGTQLANISGWDIYRTQVPLLASILPRSAGDLAQSLVNDAAQGGWLPKWPVANDYTGEMDGDSASPIIASAHAFGARNFDAPAALSAMIRGATRPGYGPEGYQERPDLADYLRYGYVPPETGGWGSAAETLEYAADDYAIGQLAGTLHHQWIAGSFLRRAQGWRKLFNPRSGYIEPRYPHGSFPTNFDPLSMTGFVEGNAVQYTWMPVWDMRVLTKLLGGPAHAVARLDQFFQQFADGPLQPYDWPGNEPGLQTAWEYDLLGTPWKTQQVVRRILRTEYSTSPGGLPGNDDLGTMSAWYVLAAMGVYPILPGSSSLAFSTPLFPHIVIHDGRGRIVRIDAPGAPQKQYIATAKLGEKNLRKAWISWADLERTGTLRFILSSSPMSTWDTHVPRIR